MESRERFEEANEVSPETVAGRKDPSRLLTCVLDSFVRITSRWGLRWPRLLNPWRSMVLLLSVPLLVPHRPAPVEGVSWAPFPHWLVSSQVPPVIAQQGTGSRGIFSGSYFALGPCLWESLPQQSSGTRFSPWLSAPALGVILQAEGWPWSVSGCLGTPVWLLDSPSGPSRVKSLS